MIYHKFVFFASKSKLI